MPPSSAKFFGHASLMSFLTVNSTMAGRLHHIGCHHLMSRLPPPRQFTAPPVVLKTRVANVCFRYFRDMLHTDVAKVDQDVAYVAMVYTRMLQTFVPNVLSVFRMYVTRVFIWMLHMFYTYVASVLSGCYVYVAMVFKCFHIFFQVFQTFFKCFIYLLLYVASIASKYFQSRSDVAHGMRVGSGRERECRAQVGDIQAA
jgi:hypothetical protein